MLCTYPHTVRRDIFLVERAINGGATITFHKGDNRMVTRDGSRFDIHESGNLYYLPTFKIMLTNVKYVMMFKPERYGDNGECGQTRKGKGKIHPGKKQGTW